MEKFYLNPKLAFLFDVINYGSGGSTLSATSFGILFSLKEKPNLKLASQDYRLTIYQYLHHHLQEDPLCKIITSKRIKLKIPAWSGFEDLEIFFPMVMWFF